MTKTDHHRIKFKEKLKKSEEARNKQGMDSMTDNLNQVRKSAGLKTWVTSFFS